MKNTKFLGIIAIVAVIVFSMAGCSNPTTTTSKSVVSIEVTTQPTKVQYNLNDEFDPAGMVVSATYSDGTTEPVTEYTTEGFSSAAAGNKTITVTYEGKTATFTVDVIDPSKETVVTPTASPVAGEVASGATITLSTTTAGAEIWYTTNGATPAKDGEGSVKYEAPITITAAVTIKAIAIKDDMNDSAILEAAYTIVADDMVAKPAATPAAGPVASGTTVSLTTTTEGAEIWYTANGSAPAKDGEDSIKYETPITITAAVTIKAIAVKDGMNNSAILEAAYTIQVVNQTPVAGDYTISGNLTQTAGSVTAITVTRKEGKSPGAVTVYYEGKEGTSYTKSTTVPNTVGSYAVTFNVAAAEGWNEASGLPAGTLTVNTPGVPTPLVDDFDVTGERTVTYDGTAKTLTVMAKANKSTGGITVLYDNAATAPVNAGTYTVTFNVAATTGWNPASGLAAGTLTINKASGAVVSAPTAATIGANNVTLTAITTTSTNQTVEYARNTANNTTSVTWQDSTTFNGLSYGTAYYFFARAKANENYNAGAASGGTAVTTLIPDLPGTITISSISSPAKINEELTATYSGTESVSYQWKKDGENIGSNSNKYTPTQPGTYSVTVSLAGFNPKTSENVQVIDPSLPNLAGTITITPNTNVTTGMELTASYSGGTETIQSWGWYRGGTEVGTTNKYTPVEAGTYTVTANAAGYNPKISAAVTVSNRTPVVGDYTITGAGTVTYDGTAKTVTVTANTGKSPGAVTVYYGSGNTSAPVNAGTYTVTFNVAADNANGWNAASNLAAGTLTINKATGAVVSAPAVATIGADNVTLTAITTTTTNQTVEYARNTANTAPSNGWQDAVTFNGLSSGTAYYFFARAKANENYNAGTASGGTAVTTIRRITSAEIEITAPVMNDTPDTAPTTDNNEEFTVGAATWSPNDAAFKSATVYAVTVTLTAKTDYTFTGLTTAKINGETATVSNNTGAAVTLSYTFPATDTKAVTGITIKTPPSKLTYTHGDPLDLAGLVVTLIHDDTTTEDVAAANFASHNITTLPPHDEHLIRSMHNGHPVTIRYGSSHNVNTSNLTVNKAPGAVVSAPTAAAKTYNSITLTTVSASNGQSVEYARSDSNSAPSTGWQPSTTFTGLSAGTTYYFFARSVVNDNYENGTPNGAAITTEATGTGQVAYYWVNEQDVLATTSGSLTLSAGETLTITAQGNGYTGHQWYLNGDLLSGVTGAEYTFSAHRTGNYTVSLLVEKGGKYYNANFVVTVQ